MTEACDLTATEARSLIGRKQLSPVELLESCIARIEAVNPALNAIVTTAYDRAWDEAKAATETLVSGEPLPPLYGMPVGIKDLDETEGIRTTYGSMLYKNFVPDEDEQVVAAARRAGGIIIGKTNTPEFGAGGNTNNALFGPTRNPFDLDLTCGGSSGGSGVALATGMAPLCQGSDTGGSLRLPATFNGVVAHRPSPGVVPAGCRDTAYTTYQTQGPMARTVADASLFLAALAERSAVDPMSFPLDPAQFLTLQPVDPGTLRVAISEDLGCAPTAQTVRRTFRERVAKLDRVFGAVEQSDPDFEGILDVFWLLRGIYMLAKHNDRIDKYGPELNPNVRSNYEAALKMNMKDVGWAAKQQLVLYQTFQKWFEDYDVLICPGVTVTPFPFDQLYPTEIDGAPMENYVHWAGLTSSLTVMGNPVVAIPCGKDENGTPFGIQIVGKPYQDRFVLGVAHALEQIFEADPVSARPVPDIMALSAG